MTTTVGTSTDGVGFEEPWQAAVLAISDALVRAGHLSATQWAQALGSRLQEARERGDPDTSETYYLCALAALQSLTHQSGSVLTAELAAETDAWTKACPGTPHGQPVTLGRPRD